jgi:Domain of unknown function (DUF4159)
MMAELYLSVRNGSMKRLPRLAGLLVLLSLGSGLVTLGRPAYQEGLSPRFVYGEDGPVALQIDPRDHTEWAFVRLHYDGYRGGCFYSGESRWTVDAPKAERQFVQGVRRLTRLNTRTIEQVVDPNSDEIYNWPWIYAVEVGSWDFTAEQAARMRQYLLRGGFLMVDDFHGTCEWSVFMNGIHKIFPDRSVEDIPDKDEIFHTLYDLDHRFQVPGAQFLYSGRIYERDGYKDEWRGIRDDNGRIMVAICHNMDLGDAWEWSDNPRYPERYTSLAYRIGVNYVIYSMTH